MGEFTKARKQFDARMSGMDGKVSHLKQDFGHLKQDFGRLNKGQQELGDQVDTIREW